MCLIFLSTQLGIERRRERMGVTGWIVHQIATVSHLSMTLKLFSKLSVSSAHLSYFGHSGPKWGRRGRFKRLAWTDPWLNHSLSNLIRSRYRTYILISLLNKVKELNSFEFGFRSRILCWSCSSFRFLTLWSTLSLQNAGFWSNPFIEYPSDVS